MNLATFAVLALALRRAPAEPDREIVKVNGTPIRQSEVVTRLLERHGNQTIDELVNELLLRQELASKKISPTAAEVDKRMRKIRWEFSDDDALEERLARQGSSVEKLRRSVAEMLAAEKLLVKEKGLAVTEEELKGAFEQHKEELGVPEGIHLRHILVKTKAEAEELLQQIEAGADLAALARQKSLAPSAKANGGDDGIVARGTLPADVEKTVFAMKSGERRAVATGNGYSVVQALERRKPVPAEFSRVKEELRQTLLEQKVKDALPDFFEELRAKAVIEPQGR